MLKKALKLLLKDQEQNTLKSLIELKEVLIYGLLTFTAQTHNMETEEVVKAKQEKHVYKKAIARYIPMQGYMAQMIEEPELRLVRIKSDRPLFKGE